MRVAPAAVPGRLGTSPAYMKKSLADVYEFLSSSPAASGAGLSFVTTAKTEVAITSAAELPIGSPLCIDQSVLVERIADDLVLLSDQHEERVLRVSHAGLNASHASLTPPSVDAGSAPGDDDVDDSPLLMRRDATVLYGGEELVFSVTEVPVRLLHSEVVEAGYLLVTGYRFAFVSRSLLPEALTVSPELLLRTLSRRLARGAYCFPLAFVRSCKTQRLVPFSVDEDREALHFDGAVANTILRVTLVDGRLLAFEVSNTHLPKNAKIVDTLLRLFDRTQTRPFAFSFRPSIPYTFDGWSVYNFFREMRRLFQPVAAVLVLDEDDPNSVPIIGTQAGRIRPTEWRVAEVSRICPTYPRCIAVPRHVTDEQLVAIAAFRAMARVPALAFLHPTTGAALVRCSQPMSGITQVRSEDDEFYFREMARRNPSGQGLVIYDARPFLNAAWNRGVKGAGYENETHYGCRVHFLDIQNCHKVRESHDALLSQLSSVASFDSASARQLEDVLAAGGSAEEPSDTWMIAVSKLLDGAIKIAKSLKDGFCVAVHCSDGWDRTPQLVSLAMVLSDPFLRTLMGFQVLIESQWIAYGHRVSLEFPLLLRSLT